MVAGAGSKTKKKESRFRENFGLDARYWQAKLIVAVLACFGAVYSYFFLSEPTNKIVWWTCVAVLIILALITIKFDKRDYNYWRYGSAEMRIRRAPILR